MLKADWKWVDIVKPPKVRTIPDILTPDEIERIVGIEKFGKDMPQNHLKTIEAVTSCRTQAQGFTAYECDKCGKLHHRDGFMNAICQVSLADVKALIEISLGFDVLENAELVAPERCVYCPDCGGKMHYRYSVLPYMLIDYNDGG